MATGWKSCSTVGCPNVVHLGTGRCDDCQGVAKLRKGTAHARRYTGRHVTRFRDGVLKANPLCVCTAPYCPHTGQCFAPSEVADHWPKTKRELRAEGLDEDDPRHGRGLCKGCHDRHTARTSPGGWNAQ